ncbi:uncharacterized protein NKAPD1 [Thalassophryne amazonica]|uniref:uncharacterized protein NKAPD1 n=1 Tax=Thalassophryne amazonica TaxID=390379 RepID=UPI001472293E|nr:uncharacterized protein NKAPD1 [Thalassophryne amazonica]
MSKLPTGKTLLRNVIRHRDAHNKIQEEMEMWKMRDWEMQMSQHKHLSATECVRGRMHCDRMTDYSRAVDQSRECVSDGSDRVARYWTRKLYEFEASDPDRWGHSGFKELYPEVFESEGEEAGGTKESGRHKMKKSKSGTETRLSKHSKKSRKKKKKKDDDKQKKVECLSSSGGGGDINDGGDRRRRKVSKSRHKSKKTPKPRGRQEDSSDDEEDRRACTPKKRKSDSNRDSCLESHKKKRKNWKTAGEEKSDDSSGD